MPKDDKNPVDDERLLASVPQFLLIESMFKATPVTEGGRRFIYIQASDESVDSQGERVLCQALERSAGIFRRFGSLDIDHITLLGPHSGVDNYLEYEIGRPVEVQFRDGRTFVKGELYRGAGPIARNANLVWQGLTAVSPPVRWFPSIGGSVLEKAVEMDPQTRRRIAVVKRMRWTNLALSRTPANQNVPVAQTVPFGALAKCWTAAGLDLVKALEAGYGTDDAALAGGAALRRESLDRGPVRYRDFAEGLAGLIRLGRVVPTPGALIGHATAHYGLDHDRAARWVGRFLADLKNRLAAKHFLRPVHKS
ncbi:MAG: hypothetical protein P4M00_03645 [Azospirillaceae bacterium]|nr:hypothetical protein [Azospirillaceae bacterium]